MITKHLLSLTALLFSIVQPTTAALSENSKSTPSFLAHMAHVSHSPAAPMHPQQITLHIPEEAVAGFTEKEFVEQIISILNAQQASCAGMSTPAIIAISIGGVIILTVTFFMGVIIGGVGVATEVQRQIALVYQLR